MKLLKQLVIVAGIVGVCGLVTVAMLKNPVKADRVFLIR